MTLALDISIRSTGYSVFSDEGHLVKFGVITTNNKSSIYNRLLYILDNIISIIEDNNINKVVVEAPSYGSRGALSYQLFGVHFYITMFLTQRGFKVEMLNIAKVKKYATGNGRATKDNMVDALPDELKAKFKTFKKSKGLYDITDSYWVGRYYLLSINS